MAAGSCYSRMHVRLRKRFLNVATTRGSGIVHANATRRDVPRAEPNRNLAA
jgi:hypothetical protein